MNFELNGKKALVTGSSSGIGNAIAATLHAEGCQVALNGRDASKLDVAAKKLKDAIAIVGDLSNPDSAQAVVTKAIKALGKLDILVCNVGSGKSVNPGEETFEEWQRIFCLNLWSATNMIEASRSALVESKGVIVCVSSICGLEVIPGAPLTYSVSKAALNAYVRGVARPLGKLGVRINAVAPGNILFEGSVWERKLMENSSGVKEILSREVSMGRLGEPQSVADLVCYLASPRASFVTGSIWTADGGQVRS